jgi:hypothetical protein
MKSFEHELKPSAMQKEFFRLQRNNQGLAWAEAHAGPVIQHTAGLLQIPCAKEICCLSDLQDKLSQKEDLI